MLVTCLCVCHNKPDLTPEAIESILGQSYPHWQAVVMDSGVLFDAGYYERFAWRNDPRLTIVRSGETEEIRRTRAMAPWCFNECFRRGLVRGDLVTYLCDDDLLYSNAFATFVSYFRQTAAAVAMYASQDVGVIYPDGWRAIIGERRATEPGGKCCNGRVLDCHVDYLQFCHRTEVLKRFPDDRYWPEEKDSELHADGVFLEKMGEFVPILPIDVKVGQNRRTPCSTYKPTSPVAAALAPEDAFLSEPDPFASLPRLRSYLGPEEHYPLVTVGVACFNHGDRVADSLDSLAAQTYPNLEVLVIDDGSYDPDSVEALRDLRLRHPQFRYLSQDHVGLTRTHNRALAEARGVYFIPSVGDTLACPDMVERLLTAIRRKPDAGAVVCHALALIEAPVSGRRPGEARVLVSTRNRTGPALFDTARLRAVSGCAGDEAFRRLVNAGSRVEIIPDQLFYYDRDPDGGGSDYGSHHRGLRPVEPLGALLAEERRGTLWTALDACHERLGQLTRENEVLTSRNRYLEETLRRLRYRIADRVHALCVRVPKAERWLRRLLRKAGA